MEWAVFYAAPPNPLAALSLQLFLRNSLRTSQSTFPSGRRLLGQLSSHFPMTSQFNHGYFYALQDDGEQLLLSFRPEKEHTINPGDYNQIFQLQEVVQGRDVRITGRGPREGYFTLGYYLTLFGARTITYFSGVDEFKELCLKTADSAPAENKYCYHISSNAEYDTLFAQPSPSADIRASLKIPGKIPSPDNPERPLYIRGKSNAYIYAAIGVYAALAQKKEIRIIRESANYQLILTPQESRPLSVSSENRNGLVIGVLGDPNSGKSIFSRALASCIYNVLPSWSSPWLCDCDAAAPTQDWYLRGMRSSDPELQKAARLSRENAKSKWTSEAERLMAQKLAVLRQNQDFVIADMPGGMHPKPGDTFTAQRIPKGGHREDMMRECDVFIVIHQHAKPEAYSAWVAELQEHGLAERIIAKIASKDHTRPFAITPLERDPQGLFQCAMDGLDRSNSIEDLARAMAAELAPFIRYLSYQKVIHAAKNALAKAFLTGNHGSRYGAAVRSAASGKIYSAGQYSSFNHATNIHAEMGALHQATMAGEPDIDVLCLACSKAGAATPCGVCRQVMLEHSQRTKRDFDVVMCTGEQRWPVCVKVSELLPQAWHYHRDQQSCQHSQPQPHLHLEEGYFNAQSPALGGYCRDERNMIHLVWDDFFQQDNILTTLKYNRNGENLFAALPHPFAEAADYQKLVLEQKYNSLRFPGTTILTPHRSMHFRHPEALTAKHLDHPTLEQLNQRLFLPAGIDIQQQVFTTPSPWLEQPHALAGECAIIIRAYPEKVRQLRELIMGCLQDGTFAPAYQSRSWQVINDYLPSSEKRGAAANIVSQRYCGAFTLNQRHISILFTWPEDAPQAREFAFEYDAFFKERICTSGRIICDDQAAYIRGVAMLETDDHQQMRIICYHQLGNLLRNGDQVVVSGNLIWDNAQRRQTQHGIEQKNAPRQTILMSTIATDKIVWLE